VSAAGALRHPAEKAIATNPMRLTVAETIFIFPPVIFLEEAAPHGCGSKTRIAASFFTI